MKELHWELLQDQVELSSNNSLKAFSQSNFDVTVATLVKRTVIKKCSGNYYATIIVVLSLVWHQHGRLLT